MRIKNIFVIFLILLFCSGLFAKPVPIDNVSSAPKPEGRPSVALVLAGGGAKGFAQIPLMELIDELGIPVDLVIGTSVGSILGGLYSAGYSAEEIKKEFFDLKWSNFFSDQVLSPFEDYQEEHSYHANAVSLSFDENFKLKLGSGLSSGQKVYEKLRKFTLKFPSDMDFNELPIPFRCVATNLMTGKADVFESGDIAEAIRCSMGLPIAFMTYEVDGEYYIDGGLKNNLATNIAKDLGYDYIIALDISSRLPTEPTDFEGSPASMIMQMTTYSTLDEITMLQKQADIYVRPEIDNFSAVSFTKAEEIYNKGLEAVNEFRPAFEELKEKIYSHAAEKNTEVKLHETNYQSREYFYPDEIELYGVEEYEHAFIKQEFEFAKSMGFTEAFFDYMMDFFVRTGNYKTVQLRILRRGEKSVLCIRANDMGDLKPRILVGINLNQTFTDYTLSKLIISPDIQLRGLTGPNSLLSLRFDLVNKFGAKVFYFQPLNPYLFFQSGVSASLDMFSTFKFFKGERENYFNEQDKKFEAHVGLGFKTFSGNDGLLKVFYKSHPLDLFAYLDDVETFYYSFVDEYKSSVVQFMGPSLDYCFDTLDNDNFPEYGFRLDAG